jgi:hypothetical protein
MSRRIFALPCKRPVPIPTPRDLVRFYRIHPLKVPWYFRLAKDAKPRVNKITDGGNSSDLPQRIILSVGVCTLLLLKAI